MEYDFITESTVSLSHASIGVRWYQVPLLQLTLIVQGPETSALCHPLSSLSLEAEQRELGCSQNSPWPFILFSVISGAANKAIWCPVSSPLVLSSQLQISQGCLVFLLKPSGNIKTSATSHETRLSMRIPPLVHFYPDAISMPGQVAMLLSVFPFFFFLSYLGSRLKLRQIPGRFHCSPHLRLLLHRESSSPFCSTFLGYPSSN